MKIKTSAIVYGIRYIRRFGLRTLIIRIIEKKREKDSEYQSFYLGNESFSGTVRETADGG